VAESWKERKLYDLHRILKNESQKLWQDLNAVDDPQAYYIPYENVKEANKRIEFVDKMLKKHVNMFNSRHPVDFLVGNVLRHKAKLKPDQMCMPGIKSDAEEAREIDIFVDEVCKDPKWFFDEVHHVNCRLLFDSPNA